MIEEYNNINQKSFPPCTVCANHTNVKLIIDSNEVEISCPKCNMRFKAPSSSFKRQAEGFHRNKQYCERDKSHSSIKGSYYCSNCNDYFCKDCAKIHKEQLTKSFHNIILLDDYRKIKCKAHNYFSYYQKVSFYCISCKDYFCDLCTNEHSSHNIIKIDELNTHYNFIKTDYYNFKKEYKKYLTDLCDNTIRKLKELIQRLSREYKNNLKRSEEIFNLIDLIFDSYDTSYPNYQDLYNVLLNSHLSFTPFEDYKSKNSNNNNIFESMLSYFSSKILFLNPFEEKNIKNTFIFKGILSNNISYGQKNLLCLLRDDSELVYFDKRNYELCVYSFKEGSLSSKLKTDFNDIRSVCKVSDDLVLITNQKGIFSIQVQYSIKIIQLQSGDNYLQVISLNDNKFASISFNQQGNYFIQLFQTVFQSGTLFSQSLEVIPLKRIEEMSIFILATKDNKYIASITSNEVHFWNVEKYSCDGVIKKIKCGDKSSMIEIDDNKLIIQGELSLYIINYLTFQIETIFQINKSNNNPFSRSSPIKIRSISILNCKDIIIITENARLIRIAGRNFSGVEKPLYYRDEYNTDYCGIKENKKVSLEAKSSYKIQFTNGTKREIYCNFFPSIFEIYSTLNLVDKENIKEFMF